MQLIFVFIKGQEFCLPLLHEAVFYILAMNQILTCLARGDTPVACFLLTKSGAGTGCGGAGTFETLGVAWEEPV